jgi:hypothetical protein
MFGSRLGGELVERRRSTRLSDWMLTGAGLTRSVASSQGRHGKPSRLGTPLDLGNVDRQAISIGQRRRLLMTTSESVGRRRRERSVLGRRLVALRGRVASDRRARVLGRRRNLHARRSLLLQLQLYLVLHLQLLVHLQLQLLLMQSILGSCLGRLGVIRRELARTLVQEVDLVRGLVAVHDRLSRHG